MTKKTNKQKIDKHTAITPLEYGGLQSAYEYFCAELFDDNLPDVFITYQRRANSAGHFAPERYSGRTKEYDRQHELSLNPDGFISQSDEQICQTLVHEMAHVWQQVHGTPSARGYHNREWAAKMKAIGLQPSSTGMVGGKETGQRMSDYIIPNGEFTKALASWLRPSQFLLSSSEVCFRVPHQRPSDIFQEDSLSAAPVLFSAALVLSSAALTL